MEADPGTACSDHGTTTTSASPGRMAAIRASAVASSQRYRNGTAVTRTDLGKLVLAKPSPRIEQNDVTSGDGTKIFQRRRQLPLDVDDGQKRFL
jgi:hypothetical protein